MSKSVTIDKFLTPEQIAQCVELGNREDVLKKVIEPSMEEINKRLEQENNPVFLSYTVQYAMTTLKLWA